jgi:hypothetical protein
MTTKTKTTKSPRPHTSRPPTPAALAKLLRGAKEAFQALAKRGTGTTSEWRRYGAKSPWVLKVSQGERTLLYLEPTPGAVCATVVLGKRATEAALGGAVSKGLHDTIRSARAYAEGRPVRVIVKRMADVKGVEELLAVKLNPDTHAR